jgi:rRNA pseudouridine-1189 N-methylase Emg1 (Nep1/Mra1 family)
VRNFKRFVGVTSSRFNRIRVKNIRQFIKVERNVLGPYHYVI